MGRRHRFAVLVVAVVALSLSLALEASAAQASVSFRWLPGYRASGTPSKYDRVGVLKTGSPRARNVLILIPGTSASAAYFEPMARTIVARSPRWQVWSIERRENLLEDQSMVNAAKAHRATPRELFDYYLGYLTDKRIRRHVGSVPDARVGFARGWGMRVAVGDIHAVVRSARRLGGKVVLGGHSLGGSITTAYATWDFGGRPGATDLAGLVYLDGASGPASLTADSAREKLLDLRAGSPWLAFGGIPAPFAGLFNTVGSGLAHMAPDAPSLLQTWPLLPSFLHTPVRVTNQAAYGYALDTETSPPGLAAAQVHAGHLAAHGTPRGWDREGELSPIRRVEDAFFGTGLRSLDGTAWYHPLRLTIDSGAVGNGIANPAQRVLGVHSVDGRRLSRRLQIYAFGAALGGRRVLDSARALARQSRIPASHLLLVDRHDGYAHVDPITAYPDNDFVANMTRFLGRVAPALPRPHPALPRPPRGGRG